MGQRTVSFGQEPDKLVIFREAIKGEKSFAQKFNKMLQNFSLFPFKHGGGKVRNGNIYLHLFYLDGFPKSSYFR